MPRAFIFRTLFVTSIIAVLAFANSADAVQIEFNLRDTSATSEIESGHITDGTVTATLSPVVQGNAGVLNQTGSSFGVDANPMNGSPHDSSALLDDIDGTESIEISFDVDIELLAVKVSSFGSEDEGSFVIGTFSPYSITSTGSHEFANNNLLLAGQKAVITFVSGNGFSFDSFTVEPWNNPNVTGSIGVPDAGASLTLLALSSVGLGLFSRRRKI